METQRGCEITYVGVLTSIFEHLAHVQATGKLRITTDDVNVSVTLDDKNINVVSSDLGKFKGVFKGKQPVQMLRDISTALNDSNFHVTLSDEDAELLKLGSGVKAGRITKAMGFEHVEVVSMMKCVKLLGFNFG